MKRLALCLLVVLAGCALEDRFTGPAAPAGNAAAASTTPTEHLGIRVLPAPGTVTIDGRADDWDLSGGIFINGSVESQRDTYGVWFHTMYDERNLYVLGRFLDRTPLNNPGNAAADEGFNGDSLQVRIATMPSTPDERVTHLTNWLDRTGKSTVNVAYGRKFDEGGIKDAQGQGARQSFRRDPDNKGYVQEIAIPWKLLTRNGKPLVAGMPLHLTVEPNFTLGERGRVTLKDVFQPGVALDRVFTFQAVDQWGPASLEKKGNVTPQPVRLADGRVFPVRLVQGLPVIDWSGLDKVQVQPGFKPIRFTLPVAGYVSLNIKNRDGAVVRQLLSGSFYEKGTHTVQWDGLTTANWNTPGEPVSPGEYTWSALYHTGLGLRLRGWAANAGTVPWDAPGGKGNWGGDHGQPSAVAADDRQVYLGWSGAEAGRSLLAVDSEGTVQWGNNRGGLAGVKAVAADGGTVYVLGGLSGPAAEGGALYRLAAESGEYKPWAGATGIDLTIGHLWPDPAGKPQKADALDAKNGLLYLSFTADNLVAVVDGSTGKLIKLVSIKAPGALKAVSDRLVYVLSAGETVNALDPQAGSAKTALSGLKNARALAVDGQGRLYIGLGEPANQVQVFSGGVLARTIGRPGGRALVGPWTPDGVAFIGSMATDARGKLWIAEADAHPKRFSTWEVSSGKLYREFFGPSNYGALGGTINPSDPDLMVGQSSEWRLDPRTGLARCLGVITREDTAVVRYGTGANGRLYLAVAPLWFNQGRSPIQIFERVGDGQFVLRTVLSYDQAKQQLRVWADENGDSQEQPGEVRPGTPRALRSWLSGWYMNMAPNLTFYLDDRQMPVSGFTRSGAPRYDPDGFKIPPGPENSQTTLGSLDDRVVLYDGTYGSEKSAFVAYEARSGKKLWEYPDNFVGVHGSHQAPPPRPGLIRGAYALAGVVRLPAPVGSLWAIPTNVGEWHLLTEAGFYLGPLFQADPFKVVWPVEARPGAVMSAVPPGAGGEDFGGSIVQGRDGRVYLQAGKTAYWNLELTGLETVRALSGASISFVVADQARALALREGQLQAATGPRRLAVRALTPRFTGDFDTDFKGAESVRYQKQADTAVRTAIARDRQNLYLAWDVADKTPWVNRAEVPELMYTRGDTVDFQLGTDPHADRQRASAVLGDLRLSIGNFKGTPTAVLYREVAKDKHPKVFSSGIVRAYRVESVQVLSQVKITTRVRGDGYVVEVAIPLAALDLKLEGLTLSGDFGVTHGDSGGQDAVLRTFWSDQQTGLVNDDVLELKLVPRNWGELHFGR